MLSAAAAVLMLCGCGAREFYLEIDGESSSDFTLDEVRAGIKGLTGDPGSYIALEPAEPIDGSCWMQAALPEYGWDDGKGYIVEVCVEEGWGFYTIYRARTRDVDEVIGCFSRYYKKGKLPNLAAWEDVTDEYYYDDYDDYGGYGYDDDYGNYAAAAALPLESVRAANIRTAACA